ncbi:phosphotransferase family protein [Phyllosticta paracitricarpa]|uniref:Phosphotransferase family protein n=1 Tax=Phyllosticta paracitricarpa TaxID=2016321 RepID=A0ABR1N371_9PEZI
MMSFDDVAWEYSDNLVNEWNKELRKPENLQAIASLVASHHGGKPIEVKPPMSGAFNVMIAVEFADGGRAVMRLPKPGVLPFREEKVRNEVAAIKYLQAHTTLPIPLVLHVGTKEECPAGLGPFFIMEYAHAAKAASRDLKWPLLPEDQSPQLDPNIDQETLERIYSQMAKVLLQIWIPSSDRIGSLCEVDEETFKVTQRPYTFNMGELAVLGTLPRAKLPPKDQTFDSSASYFRTLADLHLQHLHHQRNDAVKDADDCRRKYVARQLFSRLARDNRLTSPATAAGPFKSWCDDLRPANVLLHSTSELAAVIDWEFTYFAPAEFAESPPWWLLLEAPEFWPNGIDDWTKWFELRLPTFLDVLRQHEDAMIREGRFGEEQRLSERMRRSWDSGDFWVAYAARKSFAFDAVFWRNIFPRFFGAVSGEDDAWQRALALLGAEERDEMERLASRKMEEMKDRVLVWEDDEAVSLASETEGGGRELSG